MKTSGKCVFLENFLVFLARTVSKVSSRKFWSENCWESQSFRFFSIKKRWKLFEFWQKSFGSVFKAAFYMSGRSICWIFFRVKIQNFPFVFAKISKNNVIFRGNTSNWFSKQFYTCREDWNEKKLYEKFHNHVCFLEWELKYFQRFWHCFWQSCQSNIQRIQLKQKKKYFHGRSS